MKIGLNPFPTYYPSGVEWLGDVPVHWGVARLKGHATNVVDLARSRNDDHIYLALENVEGWTGRYSASSYSARVAPDSTSGQGGWHHMGGPLALDHLRH